MSAIETTDLLRQSADLIVALRTKIEELEPVAAFGQTVIDDGTCYSFEEAAKMLAPRLVQETGHDIGRNRLIDLLRLLGILENDRVPYQVYRKYFKIVPKKTPVGMKVTSLLTGEGLAWLFPKIVEYYRHA